MTPRTKVFEDIKENNRRDRNYTFSIKYAKKDRTIGFKARVTKIFVADDNAVLNRTVNFYDLDAGKPFKISLDFWLEYNGQKIDHEK